MRVGCSVIVVVRGRPSRATIFRIARLLGCVALPSVGFADFGFKLDVNN